MNAPDRFELFVLPDGVKKLTITPDTKMQNTSTFTVEKEDHTLGNILCRHLQKDSNVLFAGYKMPHPLEHKFVLKVQTDRVTAPTEVLQKTVDKLIGDLAVLEDRIRDEVKRMSGAGMGRVW